MSTSSLRSSSFAIGSNLMRQEAPGLFALALLSPINKPAGRPRGGIGKTALALEYAHRLFYGEHAADQVWWFGAADRLSLTAAMGALYKQLTALRPGRTAWSGRSGCAAGSRPALPLARGVRQRG